MLEAILDIRNLEKACAQVIANKGAAGIDGMQTDELRDVLRSCWHPLRTSILDGTYRPAPVRRVMIPKASGGVRGLGIPTVLDRVIQQAIAQWMGLLWDGEFSAYSYGFRPNKSAHQAVVQASDYLNAGKTHVIDLDLEKFFDKVNHDKLMSLIAGKETDKRTLQLIGRYLRRGIVEHGLVSRPRAGTPQGSPLSPLLSNIMLHELDSELALRGLSFVRYADDCSIYVSSKKAATRVMGSITRYIERTLLLKVNVAKSHISRPVGSTLLGFPSIIDKRNGVCVLLPSRRSGCGTNFGRCSNEAHRSIRTNIMGIWIGSRGAGWATSGLPTARTCWIALTVGCVRASGSSTGRNGSVRKHACGS